MTKLQRSEIIKKAFVSALIGGTSQLFIFPQQSIVFFTAIGKQILQFADIFTSSTRCFFFEPASITIINREGSIYGI